jgi:hypothetical protein
MTDAGVYRFKLMVVSDLQLHGVVHATRRCFVDDAAEYLPVPYRRTERHGTCSARSCGRWFRGWCGRCGCSVAYKSAALPYMAFVVDQHPVGALGPDSLYPVGLDYSISPRRPARLEIIAG